MLKVNYGCGNARRDGYVGVDIRPESAADHVLPAWDTSPFGPDSVDEIYSRHMIEHLDPNDGRRTLRAWFGALRPGGVLHLILPDLEFHCRQLLGLARSEFPDQQDHALAGFYGWRCEDRGGDREDAHRWGYTFESLRRELAAVGYVEIVRVVEGPDGAPWHLNVIARKPGPAGPPPLA